MRFSEETKFILKFADILTTTIGIIRWIFLLNFNQYYFYIFVYNSFPLLIYLLGCFTNNIIFLFDNDYFSFFMIFIVVGIIYILFMFEYIFYYILGLIIKIISALIFNIIYYLIKFIPIN